jgi:hypothetical protein
MQYRRALCYVPTGEVNRRLQPWAGANWMHPIRDWEIVTMNEDPFAGRLFVAKQKEVVGWHDHTRPKTPSPRRGTKRYNHLIYMHLISP